MEEIGELIRRHDDYQFEVKLGYTLHRELRKDRYTVEYFFFLPENLDVNESTYTKDQFYRDMLLYLRFMAPDLTLEELADPANERSPLHKIRRKLDRLRQNPSPRNAVILEYELKLLACVLKDALADPLRALKDAPSDDEKAGAPITRAVQGGRRVAAGLRAFRADFEDAALPDSVRCAYAFIDEYVSLLLEGVAHKMLRDIQKRPSVPPGWTSALTGLVRDELAYRRARKLPSQAEEGCDNELFVFRSSVLKKFSSSALHLSVRTEKEGRGLEEMALALSAGLAMIFATTIAFYYQKVYGTLSLSFFAALVVSYMFKDRLKALAQRYFMEYRSHRLMDLATDIFDPFSREHLGECRELVHFVPEKKIDPAVLRLRDRDHITEIENVWRAEKVLHYTKEITLFPRVLDSRSRKTAVNDISRFNLRSFLLKMDEPKTEIFLLRGDRSEPVAAARVYHVNLVIKFTDAAGVRYERVRLVLDQDGIKRLEPVRGETVPRDK